MGDKRNAFRVLVLIFTWTMRLKTDFKEDGRWWVEGTGSG
jgi:hypothetical protein